MDAQLVIIVAAIVTIIAAVFAALKWGKGVIKKLWRFFFCYKLKNEGEVLPIAWKKLDILFDLLLQFIRETHSIPDLNSHSSQELEKFLSKQDLNEDAKQNVRDHNDKNQWYFHERSEKVGNACLEFQGYITKNAISLTSSLKSQFEKVEMTIRTAWAEKCAAEESKDPYKHIAEVSRIVQKDILPMIKEIEKAVRKRLRRYEA